MPTLGTYQLATLHVHSPCDVIKLPIQLLEDLTIWLDQCPPRHHYSCLCSSIQRIGWHWKGLVEIVTVTAPNPHYPWPPAQPHVAWQRAPTLHNDSKARPSMANVLKVASSTHKKLSIHFG